MKQTLSIRIFAHSWISDWNHGNAHFLRGLARELVRMGHKVHCCEEAGAWSISNLLREGEIGTEAVSEFRRVYPELDVRFYRRDETLAEFLDHELSGADLVLVHEWNEADVVNEILARKQRLGFRALFHDTHHRAYSNPGEILRFHLPLFDGVLAFGEALRRIYLNGFDVQRVWVFHEAADISVFHPRELAVEQDLLWIGNWGDEERTSELMEFLVAPAAQLATVKQRTAVYGVRYPGAALGWLRQAGIEFRGYLPNLSAPEAYARSRVALHVPRRQYANGLSGVPTIRVFEALACGVPLVCSPWEDNEKLFRPNQDYLLAHDGRQMSELLAELLRDGNMRRQVAASGLESIRQHHTCRHRAMQLMEICGEMMQ
jgi:spore maturation protein CgeB